MRPPQKKFPRGRGNKVGEWRGGGLGGELGDALLGTGCVRQDGGCAGHCRGFGFINLIFRPSPALSPGLCPSMRPQTSTTPRLVPADQGAPGEQLWAWPIPHCPAPAPAQGSNQGAKGQFPLGRTSSASPHPQSPQRKSSHTWYELGPKLSAPLRPQGAL